MDIIRENIICFLPRNGQSLRISSDPWISAQTNLIPMWREGAAQPYNIRRVSNLVNDNDSAWN